MPPETFYSTFKDWTFNLTFIPLPVSTGRAVTSHLRRSGEVLPKTYWHCISSPLGDFLLSCCSFLYYIICCFLKVDTYFLNFFYFFLVLGDRPFCFALYYIIRWFLKVDTYFLKFFLFFFRQIMTHVIDNDYQL